MINIKKAVLSVIMSIGFFLLIALPVEAAPNPDNPNVVAYYENGIHAIPLDPIIWLSGYDLVMANGNSGNFNQWFWDGDIGYHSVWNITRNGNCQSGILIQDAYPEWGDYLVPGADYCVHTNVFNPN